jgi:hypothetical protein
MKCAVLEKLRQVVGILQTRISLQAVAFSVYCWQQGAQYGLNLGTFLPRLFIKARKRALSEPLLEVDRQPSEERAHALEPPPSTGPPGTPMCASGGEASYRPVNERIARMENGIKYSANVVDTVNNALTSASTCHAWHAVLPRETTA